MRDLWKERRRIQQQKRRVKLHYEDQVKRLHKTTPFLQIPIEWYARPVNEIFGVRVTNMLWKKGHKLSFVGEVCNYCRTSPKIKNSILVVDISGKYEVLEGSHKKKVNNSA